MGIQGFAKFFDLVMKNKSNIKTTSEFEGRIVLVDSLYRLYKMLIGKQGRDRCILTKTGKNVDHLYAIIDFTVNVLSKGIIPVYFFDGRSPAAKKHTVDQRKNGKKRAAEKSMLIEDKTSDEYIRSCKRQFKLTSDQILECKYLLTIMGIQYVDCIGEADGQCAATSAYYKDDVIGVITDDSDILAFGGSAILKDFSTKKNHFTEISRNHIFKYMKEKANMIRIENGLPEIEHFKHKNFVDFSILMGTDYEKCHIVGINNEELFKIFVLNDMNIDEVVAVLKKMGNIRISSNFSEIYRRAIDVYYNSDVIDPSEIKLIPDALNSHEMIDFLCNENDFSKWYVIDKIKKINMYYDRFDKYLHMKDRLLTCR